AARSAQLPVTRMGAGRPGCKQPFIALKGLLKQRGFEEQIQPGGFYFLRGLREIGPQGGLETAESLARLLSLRERGKRKIHLLECPRGLWKISSLLIGLGQQEGRLWVLANTGFSRQDLNCVLRFLGTHQGLGQ